MYIRIVMVSLIYMLHIAAADTSDTDNTPILAPKIHAHYHRDTQESLAELLEDKAACAKAYCYMQKLLGLPGFKIPQEAAQSHHLKIRSINWKTLDRIVYEFLTDEQKKLETSKPADFLRDPDFKGLLITNVLFQQEWLYADPEIFSIMFTPVGQASDQSASTPKPAELVPRALSKRHIKMY